MRLLIVTQKVNRHDPVLGFFCRWIEEFAKRCKFVTVICLEMGEYDLPINTKVLSLGKENKYSRVRYIIHFYKYIWRERKNYDAVFVHMNQEYILFGGLFWKFCGKKIVMWRNHYAGNILTDISSLLCNRVFCTSRYSYTAKYKKTQIMPVGINTEMFRPHPQILQISRSILMLGRVSPSKNLDLIIAALGKLKELGVSFSADIYGDALTKDKLYFESLRQEVKKLNLEEQTFFYSGVSNEKTPNIYRVHQIFINASPTGMYDKTILEAAACGCQVLAVSADAHMDVPSIVKFSADDKENLVELLKEKLETKSDNLFAQGQYEIVETKHGLGALVSSVMKELSGLSL